MQLTAILPSEHSQFLSPPGASNPFSFFPATAGRKEAAITAIPSDNHAIPPILHHV
jgi:hypothetical protein